MSHTTHQQPSPAAVVAALRAVADQLAYDLTHHDDLPVLVDTDLTRTYITVGSIDRALAVVGGMAGDVDFRETAGQSYLTKTWRGSVAGWPLCIITTLYGTAPLTRVEGDPAADLLDDAGEPDECRACGKPGYHPDTCPTVPVDAGLAWADDDEHQDVDAAQLVTSADRIAAAWRATVPVDTSPATAAAEQPAGTVDTWPAVVPAPRPPVELLPTPSWALVGMDTAFPPEPVGLVRPLTDKALLDHDPTAPQDHGDAPITPGTHVPMSGSLVTLAEVRAARISA